MIRVHNLTKRFRDPSRGDPVAVDGLSFEVRPGEVYGLLGPNGAGKTTTLRILATLTEPTSGPVDGYDAAMNKAIARRPDLARLGVQKAQAKIEAELAENQKLPALDVQLSASKDFGNGLASRRPVELEAQVLLDVPIQNRVATGRSDAARALVSRISEQERGAKDRIGADVRDSMSAMDLARARLGIARNEVDVAESLEKAEWSRFNAGDSTLLVVNLREQATFDARLREVDAKLECQRSLVLFRAATADLP